MEPNQLALAGPVGGLLDVGVGTTIRDGQFVVQSAAKDGPTAGFQGVPPSAPLPGQHGHRRLA